MFILCYDEDVALYLKEKGLTLISEPSSPLFIYAFDRSILKSDLKEIEGRYLMTQQLFL